MNNLELAARMQEMWENAMAEHGYEVKTTSYAELTIAETYGADAVEELVNETIDDWGNEIGVYTDLVLALQCKVIEHTDRNETWAELYKRLLEIADRHARRTFAEDDVQYHFPRIN